LDDDQLNNFAKNLLASLLNLMTERELIKLENQRVSLKDSGIGGLMNSLKKVDEALYEKILPEYKKMAATYNIFK
jgi:hypothetical protein